MGTLVLANGIFWDAGFDANNEFKEAVMNYFKAEGKHLNFSSNPDDSRLQINEWIEKNTGGKIKDLMPADSITSYTRLILANAIYFKGNTSNLKRAHLFCVVIFCDYFSF